MSWLLSSRGGVPGKHGNFTTRIGRWMISTQNMSSDEKKVNLDVSPTSCLHDEQVNIIVSGLKPSQDVTIKTHMKDTRGTEFMAYAHYRADEAGCVDVTKRESLGGSYEGVFPMGLIGCLKPAPHEYQYTRFFKRDVENPNIVDVSVYSSHLDDTALCSSEVGSPLVSLTHQRHYMAPGVKRIPVRYGKVRGCLFLPPGPGPFPGIVDMFGTAGGLLEYRSAQLASRGFASLALAFFAYDDLPKSIEEFNLDYFREAVDFLLTHEKVTKGHVGTIGTSKGGDLALSLATFIPEVKAAVWVNGSCSNIQSDLIIDDSKLPGLGMDIGKVKILDNNVVDPFEVVNDPRDYPESFIPIEKADANFLFLVGLADRNWKSELFADLSVERLKKHGKNNFEIYKYHDTGHILEPPCAPHCFASYHKQYYVSMLWGGQPHGHIYAQEHAWIASMKFLRSLIK